MTTTGSSEPMSDPCKEPGTDETGGAPPPPVDPAFVAEARRLNEVYSRLREAWAIEIGRPQGKYGRGQD